MSEFLLACRADGLSGATVAWYEWHLGATFKRLLDQAVDQVQVTVIRQYLADLRAETSHYRGGKRAEGGLSSETLRGRIRALKAFFNWCQREYQLEASANPMLRIRMPPRSNKVPKAIALDDLRRMFESTGDSLAGIRDRAILAFLADTGCRAGGLLSLQIPNLYVDQGRAVLHEKGDRTRAVPFTKYTAELLRAWLAVHPGQTSAVFCTLGTERYATPLTMTGLNEILRRLKKRAGITGRVNPHSFRHGFAREYLANGGDLATLARLMGHSDVSVTASFYAVFTDGELAARHELYSPLRNMGGQNK